MRLTYGDLHTAYFNWLNATDMLSLTYGDNKIPTTAYNAYQQRQIQLMRYALADITGTDYNDYNDTEIIEKAKNYIHREQDKAISNYTREVTMEELAAMFGSKIIDLGDRDNDKD